MTRMIKKNIICGLCENVNEYMVVDSTSAFGSPDLDTRPPEMERATIIARVKRCPVCSYCATDIRNAPSLVRTIVNCSQYVQQLREETNPELANSYLCKALIDQALGNYVAASWACIHAAWACDDAKKVKSARNCRDKALDMINKCITAEYSVSEEAGEEIAIQVDLLRRADHIEKAKSFITDKRNAITNDDINQILDFQNYLLSKGDVSCHTIAEAIGEKE